jgi:hypothetical protein
MKGWEERGKRNKSRVLYWHLNWSCALVPFYVFYIYLKVGMILTYLFFTDGVLRDTYFLCTRFQSMFQGAIFKTSRNYDLSMSAFWLTCCFLNNWEKWIRWLYQTHLLFSFIFLYRKTRVFCEFIVIKFVVISVMKWQWFHLLKTSASVVRTWVFILWFCRSAIEKVYVLAQVYGFSAVQLKNAYVYKC